MNGRPPTGGRQPGWAATPRACKRPPSPPGRHCAPWAPARSAGWVAMGRGPAPRGAWAAKARLHRQQEDAARVATSEGLGAAARLFGPSEAKQRPDGQALALLRELALRKSAAVALERAQGAERVAAGERLAP